MVDWCQALAVPVVGAGAELEHRPHGLDVVGGDGAVHGGRAVLGAVVQDGAAVDQRHHHPRGPVPDARDQGEGRLWDNGGLVL